MKKINKTTVFIAIGALIVGILTGWIFFGEETKEAVEDNHITEQVETTVWTCSMHPQIRQSEPGKCPICGMDLIPLNTQSSDEDPGEIRMSPTAMQLANVQTSVVLRQKPVKEVRMNGKVKVDERKIYSQSSHIPGRIERLMVSFTGEKVNKGQVLAYIYSPELVTAQEELFEAWKIRESQPALYEAARGKLMNWKLTEKQIEAIIQAGEPREQFPVLSDVSGIVLNKQVNTGDYIKKGEPLFEVADLSMVWILFDVYETDMPWVRKGDLVTFSIQSLPGETFKGNITFMDPVIDPQTRVATARIELQNRSYKFKPDMFAVGIVKSPLASAKEGLIIPKSAVMWTGERSIVYVKQASETGARFKMREVTLGPALSDSYLVKEGLREGEEIVTNGTFSIDAAAQLAGKPSMMNQEGTSVSVGHHHGSENSAPVSGHSKPGIVSETAKNAFYPLVMKYIRLKEALANDDFSQSRQIATSLKNNLDRTDMDAFPGATHSIWMSQSGEIKKALESMEKANAIQEIRDHFKSLSNAIMKLVKALGPFDTTLYIQHCPMADNNEGADWISDKKEIRNPYFGESMLTCGKVTEEIK